jgi:hypothetical protein
MYLLAHNSRNRVVLAEGAHPDILVIANFAGKHGDHLMASGTQEFFRDTILPSFEKSALSEGRYLENRKMPLSRNWLWDKKGIDRRLPEYYSGKPCA